MHAQFHHVSLLARHGQENQSFYTKLLGLRFVKNTVNQDNNRMPHYFMAIIKARRKLSNFLSCPY